MRTPVAAWLCITAALFHLVSTTLYGDLESSGYGLYLDSSGSGSGFGSGSGDWSEQEELLKNQDLSSGKGVRLTPVHAEADPSDSSEVAFENPWLTAGGDIIVVANSKSLLEREEVFAAVVAGGVTGGLLAATLSSVLIYKWHMKRDVSYILGRQKASHAY